MELFQAKDHYILQQGERALWCSRRDGSLHLRPATDLLLAWNPICLGLVEGVIGKIQLHSDLPWWLILIRQKALVGKLPGDHEVCKVTKIAVLSLSEMEPQDLELELCKKHHFGINKPEKIIPSPDDSKFLLKTFTHIKSNVSAPNKKKVKESKEKEKLERRLLEELLKMFMDSESFYYSLTYDLTNSVQRQSAGERDPCPLWQKVPLTAQSRVCHQNNLWTRLASIGELKQHVSELFVFYLFQVDDRFFWNKYMIQDLTEIGTPDVDFWIIPIIQGFVQIEELVVNYNESSDDEKSSPETPPQESTCVDDIHPRFLVALVSRRSRHRAGMRYKRRGVDKNGNVANYVETEQLIHVHNHTLSFIQTRGSVPVFWSQVGYRYNPRPRLDRSEKDTVAYFCAHFEEQLKIYKKQVIINLVDQAGREKIIGDAYLKQVLLFNNSHLTYVSFDFHEHCRGMKFENVQTLTDAIYDIILDMKWCWVDQAGVICKQEGIFRVNCMDCLDRTNVVQAAIARVVMEQQLKKLGVMPPEQPLPVKCNRIYQIMWANNGDSISRQYAGTAALKGDFTRTGERKLAGVMKDGVNSANRYYLNRFKDAYRQAVIDLMQGIPVTEDLYSIFTKEKEHEALHKENQRSHQELISQLLQSYMKLLLPDNEKFHGGWALIDCDPSLIDATHRDVDVLLLLSNSAYYVAYYDDEVDKVNQYQRLSLEDLEKIEIGPEPTLFGKAKFSCMRLHYRYKEASGYFHTLRAVMRNPEEDGKDTLQCIAEMLQITKQAMGLDVPIIEKKLERKSSKPHEDIIGIRSQNQGSLAQGKKFLMSKFSSLNQKVKQTKSNVNIGNLRKLGSFTKPEMKVNFLKPNLKVNLWKSDSSLETMENTSVMDNKAQAESDGEMSSDNDSYHSDEFLTNSKSDEDRQLANSLENVGPVDYVLPSCGIIASVPQLGSRSQSISSTDTSIHVPSEVTLAHESGLGKGSASSLKKSPSADNIHTLTGFAKPVDIYCHRFVQEAQNKMTQLSETRSASQRASEEGNQVTNQVSNEETRFESAEQLPSRPSQLDVSFSAAGPQLLSVEPVHSVVSSQKTPGSESGALELERGLHVTPSPSESCSGRAVSPFAKIRSSMVQVANITQAGLTQGISFAVAKVQKSPAEPEGVNEVQQNELKNMFTQCQTRIIQI
ncbi:phosphatidylinositide phosphatase SAC2 isoform X1 [Physeter macrocephalus]|uniref:Phosphatidylinositide phosphatase SAC2 isoform X1 n=1 Tax=Physeter macrocephalus TaxID=9755 RepID=A0A2Y9SF53_PHYMC|nr:phosphatidylinositide phosphatase SAC2 isoform X1 [Physeter catodon]|eukprot:XP_023977003.1 phosphatidylinositide phosphatase SAC2 isoform X1 [Physeter catodon]